jgi:hypothetical protein
LLMHRDRWQDLISVLNKAGMGFVGTAQNWNDLENSRKAWETFYFLMLWLRI